MKDSQMVTAADVHALQQQMEDLRYRFKTDGQLEERHVWSVMQQASSLLERAAGTKFEQVIEVIFSLISSVWSNTRNQVVLRELKAEVDRF